MSYTLCTLAFFPKCNQVGKLSDIADYPWSKSIPTWLTLMMYTPPSGNSDPARLTFSVTGIRPEKK